jgi:hypothetical protein
MDALRLLREIRDVLGPLLCGLSDDDPAAALRFVAEQLEEYWERIEAALPEEAQDGDDGKA